MYMWTPQLKPYDATAKEWIAEHKKPWDGIATGNIVFNLAGKVLILQRASQDSKMDHWETPGGTVEKIDDTIISEAARTFEETCNLVPETFARAVPGDDGELEEVLTDWEPSKVFGRFTFVVLVDVDSTTKVRLDPTKHKDFAWVTEEEVREQKFGQREISFTHEGVKQRLLETFSSKKAG